MLLFHSNTKNDGRSGVAVYFEEQIEGVFFGRNELIGEALYVHIAPVVIDRQVGRIEVVRAARICVVRHGRERHGRKQIVQLLVVDFQVADPGV